MIVFSVSAWLKVLAGVASGSIMESPFSTFAPVIEPGGIQSHQPSPGPKATCTTGPSGPRPLRRRIIPKKLPWGSLPLNHGERGAFLATEKWLVSEGALPCLEVPSMLAPTAIVRRRQGEPTARAPRCSAGERPGPVLDA